MVTLQSFEYKQTNTGTLVRQRTIPTELPQLFGEVSAKLASWFRTRYFLNTMQCPCNYIHLLCYIVSIPLIKYIFLFAAGGIMKVTSEKSGNEEHEVY
jgi:hypothetical protein